MDRLIAYITRSTPLPSCFHLTAASITRPLGDRLPPLFMGTGAFGLWSASALRPVTSGAGDISSLPDGSGCPFVELTKGFPIGFSLSSIFSGIHSWWARWRPSSGSLPLDLSNVQLPISSPFVIVDDECGERRIDYVRIIQVIVSLVGIGLSLSLMYYLIEQINPTAKEKRLARKRAQQLFSQLGVRSIPNLTDYEVGIAVNLVDTRVLTTDWNSIGGLDSIIEDLQESVIQPFQQVNLLPYPSRLLQPPKGVLLFGPPGCGKTMLARAMARAAKAYFINLQISTLVNMWYGETQKYVEATFSLAYKLQPSIIFIDELDSFLTTRSYTDNESTRMIKTQFMALWDGLLTAENTRILIVGATNRPEDLDQAILRRLPYKVSVPMPNPEQRLKILEICLHHDPLAMNLGYSELQEIASRTEGLSGSELHELCREAAFCCYREQRNREFPENIRLRREHFFMALQKFIGNRVGTGSQRTINPIPLD